MARGDEGAGGAGLIHSRINDFILPLLPHQTEPSLDQLLFALAPGLPEASCQVVEGGYRNRSWRGLPHQGRAFFIAGLWPLSIT